jgi:uncharacterized membrane protein (UPF0127 family)
VSRWFWSLLLLLVAGPAWAAEMVDVRIAPASGRPAVTIHAEVARDPDTQRHGLMERRELAADAGMLFLMPEERVQAFWMKNCYIPLDMIFADHTGRVVDVVHDAQPCPAMRVDCPTYSSDEPAAVVLEVPGGTAERLGIAPGSRLRW